MQIAEAHVHKERPAGLDDGLCFKTINVGIDIVIDRRSGNDPAELERLVFVVESREIEPESAIGERILGADFECIDKFWLEALRNGKNGLQWRIDAARFVSARIGCVEQMIVVKLVVKHSAACDFTEIDFANLEIFATADVCSSQNPARGR